MRNSKEYSVPRHLAHHDREIDRLKKKPPPASARQYPPPQPSPALPIYPGLAQGAPPIIRYPGGVIVTAAREWMTEAATLDGYSRPPSGFVGYANWYGNGGSSRAAVKSSDTAKGSPHVSFRPVDDLGCREDSKYSVFFGFRIAEGDTGHFVASCPAYAQDLSWGRAAPPTDDDLPLPGTSNWGYQGIGFGYLAAFSAFYAAGESLDFYGWADGGDGFWFDWVLLFPDRIDPTIGSEYGVDIPDNSSWRREHYYFFAGQIPEGLVYYPPGDGPLPQPNWPDQRSDDDSAFTNDPVYYTTQKENSIFDTDFRITENSYGAYESQQDPNTLYAVYIAARTFSAGVDYTDVSNWTAQGSLTWYEETVPKAGLLVPGDGAWRFYYAGMYHVGANDYQLAYWIPNAENYGDGVSFSTQPDQVRVQRVDFVPVREFFDLAEY